jgi:hypothetical protein
LAGPAYHFVAEGAEVVVLLAGSGVAIICILINSVTQSPKLSAFDIPVGAFALASQSEAEVGSSH